MAYATDGKIGVDLTATYASASAASMIQLPWAPGTRVSTDNNGIAVFARAQSTCSQYDCVTFSTFGDSASTTPILRAVPITTALVAAFGWAGVGFAQTSVISAYYGWFHLNGTVTVNLLQACNPLVPLYTTTTPGNLDDTTVSAGYIAGVVAITSASAGGADNILCIVQNPVCGAHA